jgi:6-phosphogluconolactonase
VARRRSFRYTHPMPLELHVHPTDAEAFEAAAALAAERLRAAGDAPRVALSGGRGGRGVMLALAATSDLPWDRIEWFWADERCVPEGDPRSNVRLARDSLLVPRGIRAERIHPPPLALADPAAVAAAYAAAVTAGVPGTPPIFDVLLLGMGTNGHVASLMPGCAALAAAAPVAAVTLPEVSEEPRVARVTLTPPVLAAARHVIVAVAGDTKAAPLAAVMQDSVDPNHLPAQLVRPSARVTWVVDRAAAATLLKSASPQ